MHKIVKFFDKLEDHIRGTLSHYPILYGFLGGIGIVLFWRGIWHIADEINLGSGASLIGGAIILLMSGVFVSEFIGNKIIISGLVGEKKIEEMAKEEIEIEESQLKTLQSSLTRVEKKITELEEELGKK